MSILVTAAVVYLGLCAFMFTTQRSQIYFPTPEVEPPGAHAITLAAAEAQLKIWTVRRSGPRALIYFGGNAEDVAGNIDTFSSAFPEHSLYLVNYRGYGGSTGRPSETGLSADALAVFDHVRAQYTDLTVVGRSLGSGVAVYLASERPVNRLVLVTPFDSLVNVAQGHFRYLPVRWLLKDRYDSASRAGGITAPVLVVTAADDTIIPRERSAALVAALPQEQVRVEVVAGVGHNTLDLSPAYLEAVRAFLATIEQ